MTFFFSGSNMLNQLWAALKEGTAPKGLRCLNTHRIVIHPDYNELLKDIELDSIPAILHSIREETISTDANQEKNVVKRIEISYGGQTHAFYLKLFRNSHFKIIWTRAFRGSLFGRSMLRKEYENLEKLAKCRLRSPELVAYRDHRFAGGVINSFIITKEIPQAMGVDYLANEWLGQQTDEDRKKKTDELVREAARVVRKMHDHGFEHHDLFLRNMMVSEQNMSKLYVMDAPRGYFWPQVIMRKRRAFDLATLDSAATQSFSRSQRMRFMHLYLGCSRLTDEDKQLVRKVLTISEPMRERQLKRLERSIAVDENGKPESSQQPGVAS
jgi:tRNA A-37 threonylcarbamoyl transferase component Bud32